MAYQLVYTSAAKLLDAGRSGFGTVARSKAISPLVVSALERVSQFSNLRGNDRTRTIFVHRRIVAANNRFHLLSRICDAGADYTGRTQHIAHHLLVTRDEVARAAARGLTPADVLRQFAWLDRWDGAARFFSAAEDVPLEMFQPLGQRAARGEWARVTGNPALARTLAWDGAPRTGVLLVPRGAEPLALMAEALHEFGSQCWSRSFTTALETTDEMSDIDWVITSPDTFGEIQSRCGARTVFDLGQPQSLPLPPEPAPLVADRPVGAATRETDETYAPNPGNAADSASQQAAAVRVRTRVGSATSPSSRASAPASPTRKHNSWLLATALTAVTLVLLGVIGSKLLPKPAADKLTKSEPRLSDSQRQAVSKMKSEAHLSEKDATAIASSAQDKAMAWATFIIESNKLFQKLENPSSTLESSLAFPENPPSASLSGTDWTGPLVEVVSSLRGIDVTYDNTWIRTIGQCRKQISAIIDNHGFPWAEPTSADSFDRSNQKKSERVAEQIANNLFLYFAGKRLDELLKRPGKGLLGGMFQEGKSQEKNCWNPEKYPARNSLITSKIKASFDQIKKDKNQDKFNELSNDVAQNSDFLKSELIPNWSTEEIPKPPLDGAKGTPAPEPIDKTRIPSITEPAKKVILVSRKQLKQEVPVNLLEELLKVYPGDQLHKNGLTIRLSNTSIDKELTMVTGKKYFSETYIDNADNIKIYQDGRIAIDREGIDSIKLNYQTSAKTWELLIVVTDCANKEPLVENITFSLDPRGEPGVTITGELSDWIRAVGGEVVLLLDPPMNAVVFDKNDCRFTRPPLEKPKMVFSANDRKLVKDALDKYHAEYAKPGVTKEDKDKHKSIVDGSLENLRNSLVLAIGGGLLSKALDVQDESSIRKEDLSRAQDILSQKYKGNKNRAIDPDWVKDIKYIKEQIGEDQLDNVLTDSGQSKEKWDNIRKNNEKAVQTSVDAVLKSATAPPPRTPLGVELNAIKSITIQTAAGRALFKATRN